MKRHYLISNITFNDAKGEGHREGEGVRLGKVFSPRQIWIKEGFTMEADIRQRKVMGECLKGKGGIRGGPIKCNQNMPLPSYKCVSKFLLVDMPF